MPNCLRCFEYRSAASNAPCAKTQRQRRDRDAAAVENAEAIDKAFAGLTQQLRGWEVAIGKQHFAGSAGPHAQLIFLFAHPETGRSFFKNERRNSMLRGGPVGHGHGYTDIGILRVGGEGLPAVENPFIVFQRRPCCVCRLRPSPASGSVNDQQPIHSPVANLGMIVSLLFVVTGKKNVIGTE